MLWLTYAVVLQDASLSDLAAYLGTLQALHDQQAEGALLRVLEACATRLGILLSAQRPQAGLPLGGCNGQLTCCQPVRKLTPSVAAACLARVCVWLPTCSTPCRQYPQGVLEQVPHGPVPELVSCARSLALLRFDMGAAAFEALASCIQASANLQDLQVRCRSINKAPGMGQALLTCAGTALVRQRGIGCSHSMHPFRPQQRPCKLLVSPQPCPPTCTLCCTPAVLSPSPSWATIRVKALWTLCCGSWQREAKA